MPNRLIIRHRGEGERTWVARNRITVLTRAAETDGAYGLIVSEAPRGSSAPLHIHHRSDEAVRVESGHLRVVCGDEEFELKAGDFALLPRGTPHTFVALEDSRILCVVSPGGEEAFFAEAGLPAGEETNAPPPDPERMARAAERWGAEFVGPPLSLD